MTPYYVPARTFTGAIIAAGEAVHRVPPRWRRMRSAGGKVVKELIPATTRMVPVYDTVFVDQNERYSPNGKREMARRVRQMAANNG